LIENFSSKQIFLDLYSVFQLSRVAMTRGRYRFRTKHPTDQDTTPKCGRHGCPATYTGAEKTFTPANENSSEVPIEKICHRSLVRTLNILVIKISVGFTEV